ncbi:MULTISPECIES: transcriptional regulator FeaR [Sphingobium]|uniref:HTH araC/xylS-type domain-containing protein n=1 Tax=Sphingobium cupriresistens LL01 TaxID=1420583 RepID=A0A0J7XQL2_9SPHN|nr:MULTISPECIES: transcriptional regulator FeaR [Sphingobium]KMS53353.1 hypothetical protein V473_18445 [Sphingobium cupriresistens LL01]MBJ7375885.1 transcriptional regulator FeaR [Sphingobium sp.]
MYFATSMVERPFRREAWCEAINSRCGPFVTTFSAGDFEGSIDARRIAGMDCARLSQTAGESLRGRREIELGGQSDYLVILQLSDRSALEQNGRAAIMTPGDITIIDSARPSRFVFDRKNVHISLHIPRDILDSSGVDWSTRLATTLPRSSAVLVGALLRSSFEQACGHDAEQEAAIRQALIGLIVAGWRSQDAQNMTNEAPQTATLLRAIQNHVVGRLQSEHLTPKSIAREHRISERQLHRLFQGSGLTVCRWIRQSRLDRCAADFQDIGQRERSITEIAFTWGFNDAAHFSRLFRAEFGQTASEYRAAAMMSRSAAALPQVH